MKWTMRRGPWHQFGDRSQTFAVDQLHDGIGVGAIISPRDLAFPKAIEYAGNYRSSDAGVLFDPQFYAPDFNNTKMESYSLAAFRGRTIPQLQAYIEHHFQDFVRALQEINASLETDAVIAPAVPYEVGSSDASDLNKWFLDAAREASENLGIPLYGTVILGRSTTRSDESMYAALATATSVEADGWYFINEFESCRVPCDQDEVYRFCLAGLTLCCMGRPVLHAYAGPMGLLSFAFGAEGVGIGHSQNLWHFHRSRWTAPASSRGGNGNAPPRFFSPPLWGTIVDPDESRQLSAGLRNQIMIDSPYYHSPHYHGSWSANPHLVYAVCSSLMEISRLRTVRRRFSASLDLLRGACNLHQQIRDEGILLKDDANAYQEIWLDVLERLLTGQAADYQYLALVSRT